MPTRREVLDTLHARTSATQTSGPAAAVLPNTLLLGLAKAGTTALHECLTSDAFAPRPCCRSHKELSIFSTRSPARTLHRLRVHGWPVDNTQRRGRPLLDFSPSSLSDLRALQGILKAYGNNVSRLHLLVVLRDPTERALSHFCMFAQSASEIEKAVRTTCQPGLDRVDAEVDRLTAAATPRKPRITARSRCPNATGYEVRCTARGSEAEQCAEVRVDDVVSRASEDSVAALKRWVPDAVDSDGGVRRPVLDSLLARNRSALGTLYRILLPWVAPSCPIGGAGWGWDRGRLNFSSAIASQLNGYRRLPGCDQPPSAALTMATPALWAFVRRCLEKDRTPLHLRYGHQSVPVWTLALYLRELAAAKWTFLRYEQLFDPAAERPLVEQLAVAFDLRVVASDRCTRRVAARPNSFGAAAGATVGTGELEAARAAFAPWQTAMETLINEKKETTRRHSLNS